MRLVTILQNGIETAAVRDGDQIITIAAINDVIHSDFAGDIATLIERNELRNLQEHVTGRWSDLRQRMTPLKSPLLRPLYRHPRKIWGIGLNYREHAGDLNAVHPTEEPASFMKADTTLIGPSDTIILPTMSERVTAEAEIAIVIGRECKEVTEDKALEYVAGFVAVIDMTAEDILGRNPRFLTRAKNFDTFFSLGAELVTPDEIKNLASVKVGTYANGHLHRENIVGNMTFSPEFLVAFHSQVMTLLPGDIISSGTPGAVVIRDGDMAECRIDGFLPLLNPVTRKTPG